MAKFACNIVQGKLLLLLLMGLLCLVQLISCSDRLYAASTAGISKSAADVQKLGLIRVDMVHRDSLASPLYPGNIRLADRVARAVERSKMRVGRIEARIQRALKKDDESPVHVGNGEFLMKVAVGSPSVSFDAILDTGSDLIWTQCKPCIQCYKQPTPIFDPSKSSTYSKVPCDDPLCQALDNLKICTPDCEYTYMYGDQSSTSGVLSYESLTIGSHDKVAHIGFGCGNDNQGLGFQQGGGLVGLGRGPLSLISQLGSKVDNKFSYCLLSITDSTSKTSPLFFGESAHLSGAKSMKLIQSSVIPTFYYLPMTGISVGGSMLDIPAGTFDPQPDGSGGIIIDSGTTVTILDDAAYSPLKDSFQSAITLTPADGSAIGLDLCYNLPSGGTANVDIPSLTFHFQGGVDYELPIDNYFIEDTDSGLLCLAMLSSSEILASIPSIFGNIQQQNFHILYDNGANTLSFRPTKCDSL